MAWRSDDVRPSVAASEEAVVCELWGAHRVALRAEVPERHRSEHLSLEHAALEYLALDAPKCRCALHVPFGAPKSCPKTRDAVVVVRHVDGRAVLSSRRWLRSRHVWE